MKVTFSLPSLVMILAGGRRRKEGELERGGKENGELRELQRSSFWPVRGIVLIKQATKRGIGKCQQEGGRRI